MGRGVLPGWHWPVAGGREGSPLKSASIPTPGCRDAQALHTIPRVYSEAAEFRAPSPETESEGWRSPVLCSLNTCSMGCGHRQLGHRVFRDSSHNLKGRCWPWECHSQGVLVLGAPLPENMLSVGHLQSSMWPNQGGVWDIGVYACV